MPSRRLSCAKETLLRQESKPSCLTLPRCIYARLSPCCSVSNEWIHRQRQPRLRRELPSVSRRLPQWQWFCQLLEVPTLLFVFVVSYRNVYKPPTSLLCLLVTMLRRPQTYFASDKSYTLVSQQLYFLLNFCAIRPVITTNGAITFDDTMARHW